MNGLNEYGTIEPVALYKPSTGKWHPGVRQNGATWYWPNVTWETRAEALAQAVESVSRSEPSHIQEWNVWPATL